jgi:hypothetical protein
MKVNKRMLWWASGAVAFVVAAHIGSTPKRSDDLRVAVLDSCPVAKGSLETSVSEAAVAVLGTAPAAAALAAAVQVAKSYGQPHASPTLEGATADHFYFTDNEGQIYVNTQRWRCLVVMVKDLRTETEVMSTAISTSSRADAFARYRVYFEALITHSPDRTALELSPVTLRFRQPAEAVWFGSSARDLALTIRIGRPGAKEPIASTVFTFRALVPSADSEWRDEALGAQFAKRSGWLPTPPMDSSVMSAVGKRQKMVQGPTNISVSLVETREGSLLWKLVGNVVDSVLPTTSAP